MSNASVKHDMQQRLAKLAREEKTMTTTLDTELEKVAAEVAASTMGKAVKSVETAKAEKSQQPKKQAQAPKQEKVEKPKKVAKPKPEKKTTTAQGHARVTPDIAKSVLTNLANGVKEDEIARMHNITVRRVRSIGAGRTWQEVSGLHYTVKNPRGPKGAQVRSEVKPVTVKPALKVVKKAQAPKASAEKKSAK